jgi:predicted RNA binding protein YcfA (HicA-like mRNA interferase family)
MPKKLNQLRKGKEFVDYAEKKGATVRQGKGSHKIVQFKNESISIPQHSDDLGKGLRSKIIKWFIGIGLGLLAIFFIVQNLF